MTRFVRFVEATRKENPWQATGVITTAYELLDAKKLTKQEAMNVRAMFRWFNRHLPCPPFSKNRKSGAWTKDAVSWFRTTAKEPISRLAPIIFVLRQHGLMVRTLRANYPGKIVYRDEFQVVAETPRKQRNGKVDL